MTEQELLERAEELTERRREVNRKVTTNLSPERKAVRSAGARDILLRKTYGITSDEFDMLNTGRCWCCDTDVPGGNGTFHVDHDHATGELRAILCSDCNLGLGKLGDTVEGLEQMIKVLQQGPAVVVAKLAEFREHTPYVAPPKREKYDWATILDGTERSYVPGIDFDCTAASFSKLVRSTAHMRAIKVRTRKNWDGSVSVVAYPNPTTEEVQR